MARVNTDILGISEIKWTGRGAVTNSIKILKMVHIKKSSKKKFNHPK